MLAIAGPSRQARTVFTSLLPACTCYVSPRSSTRPLRSAAHRTPRKAKTTSSKPKPPVDPPPKRRQHTAEEAELLWTTANEIARVALAGRTQRFREAGFRPTVKLSRSYEESVQHLDPALRPTLAPRAINYLPQSRRPPAWMVAGNVFPDTPPKKRRRAARGRGDGRRGYATLARRADEPKIVAAVRPSISSAEDAQAEWRRHAARWRMGDIEPGDLIASACVAARLIELN